MTTTQKLQKKLNDSKAARWSALVIVSFTMMMAYFFTDVMGPLEAPLTTKGKLVYFDNGTYLSADSLCNVSVEEATAIENVTAGNTYRIAYSDDKGKYSSGLFTVKSVNDTKSICFTNGTVLTPDSLKKISLRPINEDEQFVAGNKYAIMYAGSNGEVLNDTLVVDKVANRVLNFDNGTSLTDTAISIIALKKDVADDDIKKGAEFNVLHVDKDGKIVNEKLEVDTTIKGLGWTPTNYGFFSGAYGYINVFLLMLFFGGIILDKMGVRFTGIMSTGLMFLGAAIKWFAVNSTFTGEIFGLPTQVAIASLGFAIYGMGCEIAGITVTKVIAKWFTGHELALAMGLQVALARVGTACAMFFALPIAQSAGSVATPVFIGASALCIGLLSYIVYCVMDKKLDASAGVERVSADPDEQFKMKDLKVIFCNKGFWLITFLCLIFYSAVFPFLKFATNLMIIKYNVNPELAGMIPGLLPFGTMLLTPLFGSLYDRIGKGATLMLIGSLLLTVVHVLFALPILNVWWFAVIVMILLGIAFSLVPSAMWPSVPKIIPMKQLGSAYAIIFYIQNIGLSMVPLLISSVIESNTANGTTDYTMPMSIFALFGALAVVISLMLRRADKKNHYGLE